MLPERFLTHTLRQHPRGGSVTRILAAAIQAVEPGRAVKKYLSEHPIPLARRIFVLGLGKAAIPMTRAVFERIDVTAALVITKHAEPTGLKPAAVITGGHPVPDSRSLQAGQAALQFVSRLEADDLLLCLISGGGSALMTAPHPGLTLDDLQSLTRQLLACGARIDEINTLRRHLDRVKGGGIARAASPARVVSLILSDVVGNPLEAIASGPTAPDPSSRADALQVLEKYGLTDKVPAAILHTLEHVPETPKPGDGLFARVENVLVGSNALAAQAALQQAESEGFQAQFLGDSWQGEAREVAKTLGNILKDSQVGRLWSLQNREILGSIQPITRPFCLVAGGETTVTLAGQVSDLSAMTAAPARKVEDLSHSLGGRNQELALAAVRELEGQSNVMLVTLATDGEDGPTTAAGAVVTGETAGRARALNLDPDVFLQRNDSYHFFAPLGDLLQPGPSGTNVNDLTFLFGF
jgi:hydroxypyruvate reductase